MDWGMVDARCAIGNGNGNGNWTYHYGNLCRETKVKSELRIDKDHRSRNRKVEGERKEGADCVEGS